MLLITTWYALTFKFSVEFMRRAFHLWFLLIFYDDVYRWQISPPCLGSRQIILSHWLHLWDKYFICDFCWYFMMTCRDGKFRRHVWSAVRLFLTALYRFIKNASWGLSLFYHITLGLSVCCNNINRNVRNICEHLRAQQRFMSACAFV